MYGFYSDACASAPRRPLAELPQRACFNPLQQHQQVARATIRASRAVRFGVSACECRAFDTLLSVRELGREVRAGMLPRRLSWHVQVFVGRRLKLVRRESEMLLSALHALSCSSVGSTSFCVLSIKAAAGSWHVL